MDSALEDYPLPASMNRKNRCFLVSAILRELREKLVFPGLPTGQATKRLLPPVRHACLRHKWLNQQPRKESLFEVT